MNHGIRSACGADCRGLVVDAGAAAVSVGSRLAGRPRAADVRHAADRSSRTRMAIGRMSVHVVPFAVAMSVCAASRLIRQTVAAVGGELRRWGRILSESAAGLRIGPSGRRLSLCCSRTKSGRIARPGRPRRMAVSEAQRRRGLRYAPGMTDSTGARTRWAHARPPSMTMPCPRATGMRRRTIDRRRNRAAIAVDS